MVQGLLLILSGLSTGLWQTTALQIWEKRADGILAEILNCTGNWLYDQV